MKKIETITVLLLFFINSTFAQIKNAEIKYKIKYNVTEKTSKIKQSKLINQKSIKNEIESIEMNLLFNKDISFFKAVESMEIDNKRRVLGRIAKLMIGLGYDRYFCNINTKKIIREHEFEGNMYNITSGFNDNNWKLTNESKKIDNYNCFKATKLKTFKNRNGDIVNLEITAWYTPEIPIPLGPKNYVGLPGLILELKEGYSTFYITKIDLNSKKGIIIGSPKKGEVLTEKEYAKKTENSFDKFINSKKN